MRAAKRDAVGWTRAEWDAMDRCMDGCAKKQIHEWVSLHVYSIHILCRECLSASQPDR